MFFLDQNQDTLKAETAKRDVENLKLDWRRGIERGKGKEKERGTTDCEESLLTGEGIFVLLAASIRET